MVFVLAGNALGDLDPPVGYPFGSFPASATDVAAGDVSGDGRPDVVVTSLSGPGGGETCVLLGNAQGTLDAAICLTPQGGSLSVQLGDVDGDGVLDVVEGCYTSDSDGSPGGIYVGVRERGPHGDVGSLHKYASGGYNIGALVLGDVDRDGLLDAVVPGGFFGLGGSGVCVLENQLRTLGTVTCAGVACPCGNDGVGAHGCQNSASTGGARLTASGVASLADDTVRFFASGELPSALTIFLQGDAAIPATNFGDGLRCAGGALKRLYVKSASLGASSAPVPNDASVSARSSILGDPLSAGDVRVYQTYYRDPSTSFCPSPSGGTFNASNALSVTWVQ
jgi:FG-GAP-like repeat